jgi:hypothetical protein
MRTYVHKATLLCVLFISPIAWAGNFAECILSKMPGSANAATSGAVYQTCSQDFPDRYAGVIRGSGKGLFGYKDGNACIIKKGKETSFQPAASSIAVACRCLYDDPQFRGQTCSDFFQQLNSR